MHEVLLDKFVLMIALGIGAQWLAWRVKAPAIVFLSLAGVLAGPVFGWIDPQRDFGELVPIIIKLAVAVILFEGGLNLRIHELRQTGKAVKHLILYGCPLAWLFGTLSCYYVAGLSFPTSLILGAILVVTGPTVIMPLIRQTKLAPRVGSVLKWEGIINDPIGALTAVLVFEYFVSQGSPISATSGVFTGIIGGVIVAIILGFGSGQLLKISFQKSWIPEFLKVPIILSLVFVVYGLTNLVQSEAGLLAVTLFGFSVGNVGLRIIYDLRRFKEDISVFLVSAVFILMTASLRPEQFSILEFRSIAFFLCILFLVRPLSVWLSTIGCGLNWKERLIIGWIAPRGVVAASIAGLFAPILVEKGYPDASALVPMTFGVIFITIVLHGFSFRWLAKALGFSSAKKEGVIIVGASPWSTELALNLHKLEIPVLLVDSNWHQLRDARMNQIPVYFGEILSESGDELDLTQMGFLLAASDNDAYNALVCNAFASDFGRDRVFQLALHSDQESGKNTLRSASRGRIAFSPDLHFEELLTQHFHGWKFEHTLITESFRFEDYLAQSGKTFEPLILIRKNHDLVFDTIGKEVKPEVGDTLVSYVAPNQSLRFFSDSEAPKE